MIGSPAGVLTDGVGETVWGVRASCWAQGPAAGGLLFVVMWGSVSGVTTLWNERAGDSAVPTGRVASHLTFLLPTGTS